MEDFREGGEVATADLKTLIGLVATFELSYLGVPDGDVISKMRSRFSMDSFSPDLGGDSQKSISELNVRLRTALGEDLRPRSEGSDIPLR